MMRLEELERLADLAQGKRVLEVGSHRGCSTIALASTAQHVVAVDWHRGDTQTTGWGFTLGQCVLNLHRYGLLDKVSVVCADSQTFGRYLAEESFDLAFIDGDHRYQNVRDNLQLFLPKVKTRGHISFHDYGQKGCFEKQVVDETFGGPDELVKSLAIVEVKRSTYLATWT